MSIRIEVGPRAGFDDPRGAAVLRDIRALGVSGVERVETRSVYVLDGLDRGSAERLAAALLADPVTEEAHFDTVADAQTIDVGLHPGVTDTTAETLAQTARAIGIEGLSSVATGTRYRVVGGDSKTLQEVAGRLLANPVIQRFGIGEHVPPAFAEAQQTTVSVTHVPIRGLDGAGLAKVTAERRLALDPNEMRVIRDWYETQDRDPTDCELEMLAQTWSEHCAHKTFRALIEYTERRSDGSVDEAASGIIDGLLKQYIRKATETIDAPWVHSAFVDNAGIVAFDDSLDLAFKVETHNHPSALEPFGGANTGVGGVIRDVIGVSARPIAVTDVLCFGPQDLPTDKVPQGGLHPRRVRDGVVDGIEDYGNKMGIPTVNGAVVYDPGYVANPLVYVGCLGVLPTGSHPTEPRPNDRVVVIGGRTGRDGLRGATFSSMGMDHDTSTVAGGAVQIGHPLNEKQAMEVVIEARDARLYTAITDCGAGGLSSAVGEMAERLGANVQLADVPLKYAGLDPWEIWLSEAQERMVLAVPDDSWPALLAIAHAHGADCTTIGRFRADGILDVRWNDTTIARLSTHFLHDGRPQRQLKAEWQPAVEPFRERSMGTLQETLRAKLAEPNIASKEDIVRRFDHEVQGGTVVKPYIGVHADGPADAAVLVPFEATGERACAISVAIAPHLGARDPYAMAWAVVDEAIRNVVAVGGDPDQVSILDNFCWGDPRKPDRLGALVRCARGCHDAAIAYGAPFVSGKDSLNNEWTDTDGVQRPIPHTLLVSALSIVPNVERTLTSDFKRTGNAIYVVGETFDEWIPRALPRAVERYRAVHRAISAGYVRACHDASDGGLLVALAEMCIGGDIGADLDLQAVPGEGLDDHARAFAECNGRLLIEVAPEHVDAFERLVTATRIGTVGGTTLVGVSISDLRRAFKT